MATRRLGRLEVSALGAGCMSISSNYGSQSVTFFVYSPHMNEELCRRGALAHRNEASIATKLGCDIDLC